MPTRAELEGWLGEGFRIRTRRVEQSSWRSARWRAEFLCANAALQLYHVHDEPIDANERRIWFATPDADE
jgi:hypothetical protein